MLVYFNLNAVIFHLIKLKLTLQVYNYKTALLKFLSESLAIWFATYEGNLKFSLLETFIKIYSIYGIVGDEFLFIL